MLGLALLLGRRRLLVLVAALEIRTGGPGVVLDNGAVVIRLARQPLGLGLVLEHVPGAATACVLCARAWSPRDTGKLGRC